MISQYMLEGIEVTKAGTPDQEADVLGGTVNFKLKKDMQVYCSKETSNALKKEFSYVFSEIKYPGTPRVIINHINNI